MTHVVNGANHGRGEWPVFAEKHRQFLICEHRSRRAPVSRPLAILLYIIARVYIHVNMHIGEFVLGGRAVQAQGQALADHVPPVPAAGPEPWELLRPCFATGRIHALIALERDRPVQTVEAALALTTETVLLSKGDCRSGDRPVAEVGGPGVSESGGPTFTIAMAITLDGGQTGLTWHHPCDHC